MVGLKTALLSGFLALIALCPAQAQTVSVQLMQNSQAGAYLADGQGRALYLFLKDGPNVSTCFKGCRTLFEPVWGTDVQAEPPVDTQKFGSFQHVRAGSQLTYGGYPVYISLQDKGAGDIKGLGKDADWILIVPDHFKSMPKRR